VYTFVWQSLDQCTRNCIMDKVERELDRLCQSSEICAYRVGGIGLQRVGKDRVPEMWLSFDCSQDRESKAGTEWVPYRFHFRLNDDYVRLWEPEPDEKCEQEVGPIEHGRWKEMTETDRKFLTGMKTRTRCRNSEHGMTRSKSIRQSHTAMISAADAMSTTRTDIHSTARTMEEWNHWVNSAPTDQEKFDRSDLLDQIMGVVKQRMRPKETYLDEPSYREAFMRETDKVYREFFQPGRFA
jgi:hypothetical protein